jgi:acyl transferase domain-containing protein
MILIHPASAASQLHIRSARDTGSMVSEEELTAARATIREYESRIQQLLMEKHEPIAIVGIGLRMPGGSTTLSTLGGLAEFLGAGESAVGPVPPGRWDVTGSVDAIRDAATLSGGYLPDIDEFDAAFFSISPKEARCIDPQQRLALETSWEALENANIDPTRLRRGSVGVYFGASSVDYMWEIGALALEDMEGYLSAGSLNAAVSGRVSYFLGVRGPAISVDTACSSSLVALHLAASGLRSGECDLAVCGGVSAIHHPYSNMLLSDMEALAPDGRCKTFDESADGYGRAEGCGVVVLKRLSDAERDGDTILALVRGTAVRQDGESAGFSAPNGIAQEALMRAALASAALKPSDIQYVEAHGTGTPLGDPIEMASIAELFRQSHTPADPVLVGSLKTNIGHMEAAAGIGGVIKTVLQMRHGTVFPHLGFDKPSSRIAWDTWPVRVSARSQPWLAGVRRALVNSFGFTGTIASAILEEPPPAALPPPRVPDPGPGSVLTISAKTVPSLAGQIRRLRELVAAQPDINVADLCYTANVGRAHFRNRVSGVVASRDDLTATLERLLSTVAGGELPGHEPRKVGFLFSGTGAISPGVGAALFRRHSVFAEELDACDELLTPHVGLSVKGMVLGTCGPEDAAALSRSQYAQPTQFAIEYALARLWMSWGIRPSAVAGHSMGEIAAGAVAGLFSLADAARLIAIRARLTDSVSSRGCMASVGAAADEVAPLLAGYSDVAIAAINAPQQCVISGGRDSVAAISAALSGRDIAVRPLAASTAFHSPLMAEVVADLREALEGIQFLEPAITIVSSMSGQVARRGDLSVEYWARQVREPVNFMGAMRTLDKRGKHVFIEVGPFATLTSLGKRCVPARRHSWLASMHPADQDGMTILDAAAKAYAAGQPISWPAFHQGQPGRKVELPGYSFDRKSYRLPAGVAASAAVRQPVLAEADQAPADQPGGPAPVAAVPLATPDDAGQATAIVDLIREKVAAILEFPDVAEVAADADFTDLGMDSLLAVKLRKVLSDSLSISFPTPEIFNNPSSRRLAQFLDDQLQKVG